MKTIPTAGRTPTSADDSVQAQSSASRPDCAAETGGACVDVIDFFCGCGGTSAGLSAAGMNILAGIDLDPDAAATYRANFPTAGFIERDIRKIEPREVGAIAARTPGSRLLFSACAPCQPYTSFHRKSARRAEQRTLLLRLMPFIDHLQPDFVFVENVPGLHKVPKASTFNRFRASLERRGYSIDWTIVDCRDYGVPQRRRRLTLVASRLASVKVPAPTHGPGPGLAPWSTVRDWIGHLPPIQHGETHPSIPNHQASRLTDLNLRRVRATPTGGGRLDWPEELRLDCHATHRGHSDVYGRMHWDAAAPVLTTKCTSISNGRYGHPEQDRPISVREAASLQTFPEDFVFAGRIKSATRQVGNAVPVRLAQAVGEALLEHAARHMQLTAEMT